MARWGIQLTCIFSDKYGKRWRRKAYGTSAEAVLNLSITTGEVAELCTHSRMQGPMKSYMCVICGFVYSEAAGRPEEGIEPGTKWEDVPLNWTCPDCGARKDDFEMVEI